MCGPGSSVGITTNYGLDGPGIESRWRRDFPSVHTGPGAHPASCTMGNVPFPGVKCGQGVLLTTHPLLAPRSWKSRAILLPPSGPQPGLVRGLPFLFSLCKTDNVPHFPSITSSILHKFFFHASYDIQVSCCHYWMYLEDVRKNIQHFEFFRDTIL